MPSIDDRGELELLLDRIGVPADQIQIKIVGLEEATLSYQWRCERRANSPRISTVVSQLGLENATSTLHNGSFLIT